IRYFHVTGVQTCALPISTLDAPGLLRARPRRVARGLEGIAFVPVRPLVAVGQGPADLVQQLQVLDHAVPAPAVVDLVAGLVVAAGILVRGRLAGRGAALGLDATALGILRRHAGLDVVAVVGA